MKVEYDLKGLDKLLKEVAKKPAVVKKAVDRELRLSSLRVETRAKEYAPWDTGWMSMNIYSLKRTWLSYQVVSPVFYSFFIEYGTRYMAAQPFMYPALEEEYPLLMKRLNKLMKG